MLNETWTDQYERLKRSYALLKQVGEPTPMPQEVMPALDVLYHFCCDAFHLHDWVVARFPKEDWPHIRARLKSELLDHSPELRACADIANASKHLVLDQKSWVTGAKQGHAEVTGHGINIGAPTATMTVIGDTVVPGQAGQGYVQDTFVINVGGQHRDAQDVATKAVAAWDNWLQSKSSIATKL
jgi:hypothetical protein